MGYFEKNDHLVLKKVNSDIDARHNRTHTVDLHKSEIMTVFQAPHERGENAFFMSDLG